MAWLQTAYTTNPYLGENSANNHRKGYKIGNDLTDPDKSDAPLLASCTTSDDSLILENEIRSLPPKKGTILQSLGNKTGLFNLSLFDGKKNPPVCQNTTASTSAVVRSESSKSGNKLDEGKSLSKFVESDDDDLSDSEDLFAPPGGYQRIKCDDD